jgi:cell division protein FtsQ
MGARRIVAKKPRKAPLLARVSERLPVWQAPGWLTRRLLGGAILLSTVGGVLGFSVWHLLQPDTLPIDRVQVKGTFQYLDKKDLYGAIGNLANSGFFSVDVRAVKQAAERLAWVDSASVRRVWPNVLLVEIVEQVPLARWKDGRVVNRRGEIIAAKSTEQLNALPLFEGPEGAAELLAKRFQLMSSQLAEVKLGIATLAISERRAWQVSLSNGLHLLLGRAASDAQIMRFTDAYKQVLASRAEKIRSVDLRYTNGFSVRWKSELG